ncbi:hypothetical protein O6P43_002689 [Quillaja saponaria]|uniref:Uncharacterized protein n=1 Tax=Quillaja saponaria TaxID=32244 RepID=A0AAD7QCY2_QUISA|nr:hypothetical protein O6P43_002689 [Quillaja saponaria]
MPADYFDRFLATRGLIVGDDMIMVAMESCNVNPVTLYYFGQGMKLTLCQDEPILVRATHQINAKDNYQSRTGKCALCATQKAPDACKKRFLVIEQHRSYGQNVIRDELRGRPAKQIATFCSATTSWHLPITLEIEVLIGKDGDEVLDVRLSWIGSPQTLILHIHHSLQRNIILI